MGHMLSHHKEITFDLREDRAKRRADRLRAYYVQNPPKKHLGWFLRQNIV